MTPNRTKSKQMLNLAVVAVAGACLASIPAFGQQQDRAGQDRAGQTQREDRIGQQADQQIDRSMLPKGITWSDEPADTGEVRGVIDDAVGAVVTDGGFNDLVERFVDQDRNRFGEWMNEGDNREFTQLNESAKRFQEAYNTKFNKEFDFDAESALAGIVAVQGEIEDAAIAAANWPVKPLGQQGGAEAGGEPRVAGEAMGEPQEETREQGNIEEGRQVAVVLIPAPTKAPGQGNRPAAPGARDGANQGQPAEQAADRARDATQQRGMAQGMHQGKGLHVSLINEFPGSWKIDVPNSRQPQQVYADVSQCIDKLTQSPESWPSDEAEVQKLFAYEVMSAVLGAKSGGMEARPGMDRQPGGLNGQGDDGM